MVINTVLAELSKNIQTIFEQPTKLTTSPCQTRAKSCHDFVVLCNRLSSAITEFAKQSGCKNVSKVIGTSDRTAAVDIIATECPDAQVKKIYQLVDKKWGFVYCAGGKVEHDDRDLQTAALREGREECTLIQSKVLDCFPLGVFDSPGHDPRGLISIPFVMSLGDAGDLQATTDVIDYNLKSYTPNQFSELVQKEGEGERRDHMFIRLALDQFLAPLNYTIPPEVKKTKSPVIRPITSYSSEQLEKTREKLGFQLESVVSLDTMQTLTLAFERAIEQLRNAPKSPELEATAWKTVRDKIFKPLTKDAQKWLDTLVKTDGGDCKEKSECARHFHQKISFIDALEVNVRYSWNGQTVVEPLKRWERLSDAVARGIITRSNGQDRLPAISMQMQNIEIFTYGGDRRVIADFAVKSE